MKKILSFIAMAAFVAVPMFTSCTDKEGDDTTVSGDKTELQAELAECEAILADATTADFPQEAIDEFEETLNAINSASEGELTQTVINNLLAQLSAAKDAFLSQEYGAIPSENLLLSYDFETEDNPQVSAGTLKYEAAFATGPEEVFGSNTSNPTFVDGINGGKAISFDNGSHLEIASYDYNALLKDAISISVWVKPTAIVAGNYVFSINKWNTCKLNIQNEGKPFFTVALTNGETDENGNIKSMITDADNEMAQSVKANEWTHIVVTFSRTTDVMDMYVNGALTKSWNPENGKPNLAGASWNLPEAKTPIMIGTSGPYEESSTEVTPELWESGESFNGAIDNLHVYDIALEAGQVEKLYNDELGK